MAKFIPHCPLKLGTNLMNKDCSFACPWFIKSKDKCAITVIAELMVKKDG